MAWFHTYMVDIGVVGAGIRGQLFAAALRQCADVRVVAFADPSPAAEQVAARFGARLYGNHRDLLAAHDLAGLVVATPDFAHRDAAVDAARAGVNLLIEKPLATDAGQAREIQQAIAEAGVRAMVAFENRWNPKFVVARQQITEDAVGDVLFQTAHLNDTRYVPEQMLSWAAQSTPAWFLMPHTVDLALWLSGKRPLTVYATGLRRELVKAGIDTYDGIHALVTFDDETTLALQSHWVLPESYPSVFDFRYEIVGSKGTVRIDGSDSGVHFAGPAWKWLHHSTLDIGGRITGVAADIAQCFADLLADRAVDVPSVEEAVLVTSVVEAVHASIATGEPIQLT
jgi:predicted dehydrogenase